LNLLKRRFVARLSFHKLAWLSSVVEQDSFAPLVELADLHGQLWGGQ
jgi:hypothetical protein